LKSEEGKAAIVTPSLHKVKVYRNYAVDKWYEKKGFDCSVCLGTWERKENISLLRLSTREVSCGEGRGKKLKWWKF